MPKTSESKKTLIYLANLTHVRDGRPSTEVIPINIGLLATYLNRSLPDITIELFNIPAKLEQAFMRRTPDVLACSNYIWNSNLNYLYLEHYKKLYPRIVTVMGGPNYPGKPAAQKAFLKKHPSIDFYVYMDGEAAFCGLIKAVIAFHGDVARIKKNRLQGVHFLRGREFINGGPGERLKDLEDAPSPYLAGLFDGMLAEGFVPMLHTNKGCPFSCAYCCSGNPYYNKVYCFAESRILQVIRYLAKRAKAKTLQVTDDNYGMFPQDVRYSRALNACRKRYQWPLRINVTTSKTGKDRVFDAIAPLGDAIFFSASMQSMNRDTLREISRKNLPFEQYHELIKKLLKKRIYSLCELIIGLPEETKNSHMQAIRQALNADVRNIDTYTCMLLDNSRLYEDSYFKRFKMVVRYRVLPRDYGIYLGRRVLETERVCVATRTLPLSDYLDVRAFNFILSGYKNLGVFQELLDYLKSTGVSVFELLLKIHRLIRNDKGKAGRIYREFRRDAKTELFKSKDELLRYFGKKENFDKLLKGELGANLIQKYQAVFLENLRLFADFLRYAAYPNPGVNKLVIDDLLEFCLQSRGNIFCAEKRNKKAVFRFDIPRWIRKGTHRDISEYAGRTSLVFFLNARQKNILRNYKSLYGDSLDSRGKIMTRIKPSLLFRGFAYADKKRNSI